MHKTFRLEELVELRLIAEQNYVAPYAEESRFWHSLWTSAGKPRSGELYAFMKSKKSHYKYAVRRLKRCSDMIANDNLLESLLSPDKCIFEEVKKLRKKSSGLSSRIDGHVGSENITGHFSNIYSKLYNNVSEEEELITLMKNLDSEVDSYNVY